MFLSLYLLSHMQTEVVRVGPCQQVEDIPELLPLTSLGNENKYAAKRENQYGQGMQCSR